MKIVPARGHTCVRDAFAIVFSFGCQGGLVLDFLAELVCKFTATPAARRGGVVLSPVFFTSSIMIFQFHLDSANRVNGALILSTGE